VPARAAGNARAGLGAHRQRLVDGRDAHVPRRRHLQATKYAVEAISDALRFEVAGFGVRVVVIQPGLIRTGFGDAAAGALEDTEDDGPYAAFNAAVGKATQGAYEGGGAAARLGGGPETVARTIERALTTAQPKARYRVTPSAHVLIRQRALMPDRLWDRFVATQFPRPGAE